MMLVPRLQARKPGAAQPLAASIAIALALLGIVALWRFTPPPRTLIAAEPASIHLHAAG